MSKADLDHQNQDLTCMNEELRIAFESGINKSYESRIKHLNAVKAAINLYYDEEACSALTTDLGRSRSESSVELQAAMAEINTQLSGLKSWMKPEQKNTHMMLAPAHTEVRREAFGVVLVLGPFNYPMSLCLVPVIGAIAAGNVVVLKPSEMTGATEKWFHERLAPALPSNVFRVVVGDIPRTTALLKLRWDFIFFTGSPRVGAIVSKAAANFVTPSVMELGGKSPVYVDDSCGSISEAAKRIVFGKFINSGQTCMAPDYLLVHKSIHKKLIDALVKTVKEFYSEDPSTSLDYGRMCTELHAQRIVKLIDSSGGVIKCGGSSTANVSDRFVPPTIIDQPPLESGVMQDELFDSQPLAFYIFGTNHTVIENMLGAVQSGDAMINDTFLHYINPGCPFGGVGKSGHGTYRGRYSFETFTYPRGVIFRHSVLDIDQTLPCNARYPPSGKARNLLLPYMVGLFPSIPRIFMFRPKLFFCASLVALNCFVLYGAEQKSQPPLSFAKEILNTVFLKFKSGSCGN